MNTELYSGAEGADTAVKRTHDAFLQARRHSYDARARWLEAIADALEAERSALVDLAREETHLPQSRLEGELTRTCFQLKLLAGETRAGEFVDATIDAADLEWGMGARPDIRRMRVPIGVVGVFGASNFPFAFSVIGGDSAAALAAGCGVVHKIHSAHLELGRLTIATVADALQRAEAPEGLITGIEGTVGAQALVDHPLTSAIGFTGSEHVGRMLFDRAMAREKPIPFYGELGSLNPVIVTEPAWAQNGDDILAGFADSMTAGTGQFCTKPGLLIMPATATGEAIAQLPNLLADKPNGPMLTDSIRQNFLRMRDLVTEQNEISVLAVGDQDDPPRPAVLRARASDLEADSPVLHTEMFGPAAVLITYDSDRELLALLDKLPGQLTTTFHSGLDEECGWLVERLSDISGRVLHNGWPTGVTVSYAQNHGGPYPAATTSETSVGTAAVARFTRPVAFQNFPQHDLPEALQDDNPLGIRRRLNGIWESSNTGGDKGKVDGN